MKRIGVKSLAALMIPVAFLNACTTSAMDAQGETAASMKLRSEKAAALFRAHCATAGVRITRTVEGVDGIMLMNIRPEPINYSDQFKLDDPYGRDYRGDAYIKSFLKGFFNGGAKVVEKRSGNAPAHLEYQYVAAVDLADGKTYRYTAGMKEIERTLIGEFDKDRNPLKVKTIKFTLEKTPWAGPLPRYGVQFQDISTQEDREHWIAGSSLRVIDLHTNEVIGERIGYMWDAGMGSRNAGRSPWLLAADNACPSFGAGRGATLQPLQTENFVESILKPSLK